MKNIFKKILLFALLGFSASNVSANFFSSASAFLGSSLKSAVAPVKGMTKKSALTSAAVGGFAWAVMNRDTWLPVVKGYSDKIKSFATGTKSLALNTMKSGKNNLSNTVKSLIELTRKHSGVIVPVTSAYVTLYIANSQQ